MQKFFFHHLDLQCCSSIKTLCKVVSHCNEYFYYACTFNSLCMCVCTKSQEAHQVNPMHPVTQLQNTPALTSGIWGTSTTWRPCCCFGTCGEMDTFWKHNGELAQRWTVCTLGRQSGWTSCVPSSDTGGVWYVCISSPPVYWDRNCRVCGPSFLVLFCV